MGGGFGSSGGGGSAASGSAAVASAAAVVRRWRLGLSSAAAMGRRWAEWPRRLARKREQSVPTTASTGGNKSADFANAVNITADPATNSLVISAAPQDYEDPADA